MRIDDQAIHCIVEPEFCDIGKFFPGGWILVDACLYMLKYFH